MKRTYLIFLVLAIGMLILGIVFAGAVLGLYFNVPAFIIVVFLPAFMVIGVYGLQTFLRSFRLVFDGTEATSEQHVTGAALFSMLGRSLLLTGFITTMIGLIAMLGELREKSELGRTVAIALITLFYSLILMLLVSVPFKFAHEKRLAEMSKEEK